MYRTEFDLPEPPDVEPVGRRPWWMWPAIGLAIVLLAISTFYIPLPMFYQYLPGPVRDVEELVIVSDATTYSSEGHLYLTTVSVDTEVTVAEFIGASFSDDRAIVRKEDVTGGAPLDELRRQQRAEMQSSKQHATEVVLSLLGIARPSGDGARVVDTISGLPASEALQQGDVIVDIDGEKVETTCDVQRTIDGADIGEEIAVTVQRGGDERSFQIETVRSPDDSTTAFIGVAMEDVDYWFDPGLEVEFKTGEIAGPSAGLMMSLALYDQLTPDDLTEGLSIAGTGTIECGGRVGAIGGIEQKVAGAEAEGAQIFFAPRANAAA